MKKIMRRNEEEKVEAVELLKYLLLAYIVTAVCLFVLALLLYKVGLTEQVVSVCMIFIYAGTNFLAGFLAGKQFKKMKFVWGLILGLLYFGILAILSLIGGRASTLFDKDFILTLLFCVGGGMLGGMFS